MVAFQQGERRRLREGRTVEFMIERQALLELSIDPGDEVDAEALAGLTYQLRQELLELDVLAVEVPSVGEAPAGTRGVDLAGVGQLVVSLMGSGSLLGTIVATVQAWAARLGPRSVRLQLGGDVLEVTGVSTREQHELVRLWIDRHKEP